MRRGTADAQPDVVATACLVALMSQARGFHCVAEAQISRAAEAAGSDATVISSAGALLDGLRQIQARKIALIAPYMKPLTQKVIGYLESEGFEVHDSVSLEVPDNAEVGALDPAQLHDHWRRLDLTGCDALVLSACVQMPSLPVLQPIEDEAGDSDHHCCQRDRVGDSQRAVAVPCASGRRRPSP